MGYKQDLIMDCGYFYVPYIDLDGCDMNEHLELVENLDCTIIDTNNPQPINFPIYQNNLALQQELEQTKQKLKDAEAKYSNLEVELYEEYDKKMTEFKDYIVTKVHDFLNVELEKYQGDLPKMVAEVSAKELVDKALQS